MRPLSSGTGSETAEKQPPRLNGGDLREENRPAFVLRRVSSRTHTHARHVKRVFSTAPPANNAMDATAPALAPAPAPAPAPALQDEGDLLTLSIIDWEIGVVDQNCRQLLRVLAGSEETYAGMSNQTPRGRAQLKRQLHQLQLEKAEYREKREALILRLSQQQGARNAAA